MATTVNSGRDFFIQNVTVGTGQTAVTIPSQLTSTYRVSSILIQCRTAVAMNLTRSKGDGNFFTIPASTAFSLDINPLTSPIFYLTSQSGTIAVDVLFLLE